VYTALTLLSLVFGSHAHAAEPAVITLSCDGKMTTGVNGKPEPVSKMGLIVNLDNQTVSFSGVVVGIRKADAANIAFDGDSNDGPYMTHVDGNIDRVTGSASFGVIVSTRSTPLTNSVYDLLCKPTTRIF
jgi:hypothetical protein